MPVPLSSGCTGPFSISNESGSAITLIPAIGATAPSLARLADKLNKYLSLLHFPRIARFASGQGNSADPVI
jgi:hypothetical protein